MTQTPTDALRLLPNMPTVVLTDDMLFKIETGETVTWGELKRRQYEQAVRKFNTMREDGSLPAPASPLPGGGLEPLSDDPAVASMCDSSYRAGALAGWNAAHHSDPEEGERIMSRIRSVEPGSLAPIVERNRARQQVREYDFKAEDEWFEPLPAAPTGEPK